MGASSVNSSSEGPTFAAHDRLGTTCRGGAKMLTAEDNARLTRVGPGSPCGELLRRYWHPVAQATDLTDDSPTKFVRILGDDLVLFRDKRGAFGLLADHCAHRGASLLY